MKIYTKTGDEGETSLYGGERVSKDSLRVWTYGTVDECNAVLGLAVAEVGDDELRAVIVRVQGELMVLGADIATPLSCGDVVPRVTPDMTAGLESEIDRFEMELEPLRNFILPGGSRVGALVHQARAICRRAERHLVALMQREDIGDEVQRYVNRLSDHLFVVARTVNHRAGKPEPIWERPERS
jgi:cob(I)alamin adenosyltransferase